MSNTKEIPTYCRYCHKVQITFDQSRKSKSGKLIPIEKSSGLPHECDQRPKTNGGGNNTTTTIDGTNNTTADTIISLL
jgi:hypothetical protein